MTREQADQVARRSLSVLLLALICGGLTACGSDGASIRSAPQQADLGVDPQGDSVQWSVVRRMEVRQWQKALNRFLDKPADSIGVGNQSHPDLDRPELIHFVEKTFRLGVRSWVVPDDGDWIQSDAHGRTWIPEAVQSQHLWVYAEGCYPQEFEAGELQRINQMSPSTWSILRVVTADGEPVAGLEATWWSHDLEGDRYEPRRASSGVGALTTTDGFAWIAAARGSIVDLGNWNSPDRRTVQVPSGASVVIEEHGSACMLRLALEEPDHLGVIARLEVSAPADRFGSSPVADRDLSDSWFLQPRFGPLVVELKENLVRFAEPLGVGWSRLGPTTACFWGATELDTEREYPLHTAELKVVRHSVRLWLEDREDQFQLYVPVRYRLLPGDEASDTELPDFEVAEASQSGLTLPEQMVDQLRMQRGTLELWPLGTTPERLPYDVVLGGKQGRAVSVEFDRAQYRLIRVVDRIGRTFAPRLCISTGDGAIYSAGTDDDGLYPLDWIGGDVIVRAELPSADAPPGELVELARIPAAAFESGFGVDLHVGLELGTVEVYGANWDGADIVLVDHSGKQHRPARRDSDRVIFVDVPPGQFVVAPGRWASQWWTRRQAGGAVGSRLLGSGETLRVPWDHDWGSDRPRSGTVGYAASKVHGLFIVPCYGPPSEPVPLDIDAPWISIDSEGEYKIHEREPIPSALLICSLPEDGGVFAGEVGSLLVHEVIEVGESVDLPLGEVELVWAAEEWEGPLKVTWEQSRGKCRHPLAQLLARNATTRGGAAWPTSANRVLKRLDPGVLTLRFESASSSWTETVEVEANSRVVLEVRE